MKTHLLLAFLLAGLPRTSFAQSVDARRNEVGRPFIRNYSPKEYEAHPQNWAIVQDSRGLMYFGNGLGVLEYDAVSWRLIVLPNKSVVRSLDLDEHGRIYVGAQGDFGYLAPDSSGQLQFVSLLQHVPPEEREFTDVWRTFVCKEGVYFQTSTRLFRYSPAINPSESHRLKVWKPATRFNRASLVRGQVYLPQVRTGLMRVQGDSLHLLAGTERFAQEIYAVILPYEGIRAVASGVVPRLGADKMSALRYEGGSAERGAIVIATATQGLFIYDKETVAPFRTQADDFLRASEIYRGAVLQDGSYALATRLGGVALVDHEGRVRIIDKSTGLRGNKVYFAYGDRHGALWLGLENGISQVETPSPVSLHDELSGLKSTVYDLIRHNGVLYVSTNTGVFYLDAHGATFTPVAGIAEQSWALLSFNNDLLVATGDGVYRVAGERAVFTKESRGESFVALALQRSQRESNRVYVGLTDGLASLYYDAAQKQWRDEGRVPNVYEQTWSIVETQTGALWLGTDAQGVLRVQFPMPVHGANTQPVVERFGVAQGLAAGGVQVFSVAGKEYFATTAGIFCFPEERRLFVADSTFAVTEFGNTQEEYNLKEDGNGNVWLNFGKESAVARPGPAGRFVIEKTPFLRFADAPTIAIYPEDDGVVWFGGADGLVRYDGNIPKDYAQKYSALLRRVIVDEDSVIFAGAREPAQEFAAPQLPYRDNSVRFEFCAAFFHAEAENRYQTFLEGFDDHWSAWSKEAQKVYTNLPHGDYRFRVRAQNIYQTESAGAVYAFQILAPWYRAWWAYLLYVAGFAALLSGLIFVRTRQLRARSRALERNIAERTQEIRQQALALKSQTEELETIDGIVKVINRELALENVLKQLLEQGMKLVPQAEQACVLIFDHDKAAFHFAAALGYDNEAVKKISFTPEEMAGHYAAGSEEVGKGVFVIRKFRNLEGAEKLQALPIPKALLVMSAIWDKRLEGFVIFTSLSNAEAFDQSEVRKLSRFREHAISAIAKAKVLRALEEKNQEIIRTQQQLIVQEQLASLGQLTAGIAHEIKNPLNFVNNFAKLSEELLQELHEGFEEQKSNFAPEAKENLQELLTMLKQNVVKINEHGRRADSIVKGMLLHSRGESAERRAADVNAILEEYVMLAYHGMRGTDTSFNVTLVKNYDPTIGRVEVYPQDLSRVFLNLVNNACYATHEKARMGDGVKGRWGETKTEENGEGSSSPIHPVSDSPIPPFSPTITITTKNLGEKVEIRIRDNGNGIPQAIREKIFKPFFTTKPAGQGTGLGLSISYDIIVHEHNGELKVETEEGKFTEFVVRLPKGA